MPKLSGHKCDSVSINQSMTEQNRSGASMQPCLTPDAVLKEADKPFCERTRTVVPVWRLRISCSREGGMPSACSTFHRADLSTESKADFTSMYATCRSRLKARCSSANIVSRPEWRPQLNDQPWNRTVVAACSWSEVDESWQVERERTLSPGPRAEKWAGSCYNCHADLCLYTERLWWLSSTPSALSL